MTVADYLKQLPGHPVYLETPAGLLRVAGVTVDGHCLPFVRCIAPSGDVVEWAALFSTELEDDVCPDCLGSGEVPSSDMPGMTCVCPCQCDEPAGPMQYP